MPKGMNIQNRIKRLEERAALVSNLEDLSQITYRTIDARDLPERDGKGIPGVTRIDCIEVVRPEGYRNEYSQTT